MSSLDVEYLSEQLTHTLDLVKAELRMVNHRLEQLEKDQEDHEKRIRQLTDSSTQFKVLAGLATGGGLLSIASLLKLLFGT